MPFNAAAVNAAHTDPNQQFSSLGVIGTLGTADTGGTALTLPFAVDAATGAAWGIEIGTPPTIVTKGTISAGTVTITGGTINAGTFTNTGTNVNIVTGTINVGTFNNAGTNVNLVTGSISTGTLALVTRIGNIGTIESGTVTTSLALNTGTITTIVAGTQNTLGTIGVVNTGTITALASGTITAGTVNSGTYSYMNFTATGTTTLKTGSGILHSFIINSKSVGGAGTLFDNTAASGTVIAVVDTTLSTTAFLYDLGFSNLTFAWVGNTGGNVTITYK